ncbi:hypothetical protein AB0N06_38630 [Streptomyces sp. NPDC051020]|uniref:hypothetical protein n=1 Tax=Streptomyces sp. NPDC051020 TaxID=3155409 RepID=UPI003428F398
MATTIGKGLRKAAKAAGITAAVALLTVGTIGQAQASTSAGYMGDGYANNTHGVWCVQHLLNDVAQDAGQGRPLAEDGLWGPNTKSWVKWYQSTSPYNLTSDGVVGKGTGGFLLLEGDQYYGGRNYCYDYVPSYF